MEPLSRTFDKDADDEAAGPRTELLPFLFVALECSRPLAGGMRVALAELDEITVGRGSTRRFVRSGRSAHLSLPDKLVSSRHARTAGPLTRSRCWVSPARMARPP